MPRPPVPLLLVLVGAACTSAAAQPQPAPEPDPVAEAETLLAAGAASEAAALLEGVLARDGRDAQAHGLLALLYAEDGPLHDLRRADRHARRAAEVAPQDPRLLETRLRLLQRTTSEERAFSLADTRRPRLARRILALDSASAVAHEERALAAFLEFDWRRGLAETTGDWQPEADGGMSGAANRALRRTHAHLERALRTEPRRASAHRLRLRARAAVGDDAGLLLAARQYHAARPESADASLFLGLARFRTGDVAGADAAFRAALERMGPPARAAFSDLTLLLDRDGRDAYAADSAAVAAGFWEGRDPRLLTDQNERWLEHAARLALADLLFSDPRTGRRGWESTRGEMAVRYGLPLTQRQWMSARDGRFVAWDYGDFQLLFEDTFVTGEAELWSSYEGADMVTFARSLANRMPERADYRPPSRVTFPFAAYAFRGGEGRTDLYVRYGVPVAEAAGRAGLRSGAFLLADGRVVAETRAEAARFRPGALRTYEGGTLWTDGLALQAAPGSYELAVEFEQDGSGSVGFERVAVELPAFPAGGLAVSDVVLAYGVEEAEPGAGQGSALVRRGLSIDPAPWGVFGTAQPVYVYVEVYGLTPAADGRTRYAVEATLRPQDTSTGLARLARSLFGRRERGVAVAYEADGTAPDAGEYVALDVSEQAPGPFTLTLAVRDLVAGTAVERTTELYLE